MVGTQTARTRAQDIETEKKRTKDHMKAFFHLSMNGYTGSIQ